MIDGRFSIGEAAKRTGLSVKAIRYYADQGIVPASDVTEAGYRLYCLEDLWRLGLVRILRHLEFGLPEIRAILARSPGVAAVVRLQREALDLQIRRLSGVRSLLDRIPDHLWADESAHHLTRILEAMHMSKEDRERFIEERWSRAMLDGAPEEWREQALRQLRELLPEELSPEQATAWSELHQLLSDPQFQGQMQAAIRPFWQLIQHASAAPEAWSDAMGGLLARARAARQAGAAPEDSVVQSIVADWITTFSEATQVPQSPEFIQRFARYAEQILEEPNRTLWDIMRRLVPDRLEADHDAQMLMIDGLRWRMAHGG